MKALHTIAFYDLIHGRLVLLERLDHFELKARPIKIVRFPMYLEILVSLQKVSQKAHPYFKSDQSTAQQLNEAFPYCNPPRYMLRDRDSIYGVEFVQRAHALGLEQKVIAARSLWQNPFVERLIGSIRCECLDQVIVLHEHHFRQRLTAYFRYYHQHRPHRSLDEDVPESRAVEPPNRATSSPCPC